MFLGEIFRTKTKTIDGWPDPSHKKLTQTDPDQKFLTRTHHYTYVDIMWSRGIPTRQNTTHRMDKFANALLVELNPT